MEQRSRARSLPARVVRITTREKPPNATHWSTRTMARAAGISKASVGRIWQQLRSTAR